MSEKKAKAPRLGSLIGRCIVVTFINGEQITGFLLGIDEDLFTLTLSVAGALEFVPLYNVQTIREAEGTAC